MKFLSQAPSALTIEEGAVFDAVLRRLRKRLNDHVETCASAGLVWNGRPINVAAQDLGHLLWLVERKVKPRFNFLEQQKLVEADPVIRGN